MSVLTGKKKKYEFIKKVNGYITFAADPPIDGLCHKIIELISTRIFFMSQNHVNHPIRNEYSENMKVEINLKNGLYHSRAVARIF